MYLGLNSVLFKAVDFATACKLTAQSGYDGIEVSAIKGMCEHLDLDNYKAGNDIVSATQEYGLKLLSMELASLDEARVMAAFEAGQKLGIPIVNVGSGGQSGNEDDLKAALETLQKYADAAATFGVTLCCKAHVGSAVYNTPTTLQAIEYIKTGNFGIDMDPSHIHRAGENPADALDSVIGAMKHVHIRDCIGNGPSPGLPLEQICGRGNIDLKRYMKILNDNQYSGPVCLEVIGAEIPVEMAVAIAAESIGYMKGIVK